MSVYLRQMWKGYIKKDKRIDLSKAVAELLIYKIVFLAIIVHFSLWNQNNQQKLANVLFSNLKLLLQIY